MPGFSLPLFSTVTVTELATRAHASGGQLSEAAYRGVVLATAAMLVRNAVILGLLAPAALLNAGIPFTLMLAGAGAAALVRRTRQADTTGGPGTPARRAAAAGGELPLPSMESPFSLTAALKFGMIFLALQAAGTLAQHALGHAGFYAVSAVGDLISSASAVASAANLAASGTLPPLVAGIAAILASLTSAMVNLPLVARLLKDRALTWRLGWVLGGVALLGAIGAFVQAQLPGPLPSGLLMRPPGVLGQGSATSPSR